MSSRSDSDVRCIPQGESFGRGLVQIRNCFRRAHSHNLIRLLNVIAVLTCGTHCLSTANTWAMSASPHCSFLRQALHVGSKKVFSRAWHSGQMGASTVGCDTGCDLDAAATTDPTFDGRRGLLINIQPRYTYSCVLPPESLCLGGAAEIGDLATGRHSTAPACCRERREDS